MEGRPDSPIEILSDPETHAPASPRNPDTIAATIERRLLLERQQQHDATQSSDFDEYHEKRQEFRRLVDPGIMRPNARKSALEALEVLIKLAENILANPSEQKFQKFKPTNDKIKRLLVDQKGTLEYAIALGFRPEVENFQPYYVFNPRKMSDLRIGCAILKEFFERETEKESRLARAKREEKAVAAAAVANVKKAFLDDRKSRALQEQREREQREARAAAAARQALLPPTEIPAPEPTTTRRSRRVQVMPGAGHTLAGGEIHGTAGSPPPYDSASDDE